MRSLWCCLLPALIAAAPADRANAQEARQACRGSLHFATIAELTFGRDIGARLGVSEAAWRRFVAREITPRFPEGLTVTDATGQWRDRSTRAVVREPSKLVLIVLPGNADDQARLDAIVAAYKREFRQNSVGVIEQPACVSF